MFVRLCLPIPLNACLRMARWPLPLIDIVRSGFHGARSVKRMAGVAGPRIRKDVTSVWATTSRRVDAGRRREEVEHDKRTTGRGGPGREGGRRLRRGDPRTGAPARRARLRRGEGDLERADRP